MKPKLFLAMIFLVFVFEGCRQTATHFQLLPAESTGIQFTNTLTTNDTLNALHFEYVYNGAGVAAGDLNNDGLVDLFFAGNQVSSKLYLNRGNLKFMDLTQLAGVATDRWCTGVALADVNDDGKLDIYVSVAGFNRPEQLMENLLFINQGWDKDGVPTFVESAAAYGLNDSGYSTQAAFFDYDLDGDLDLYLLTNGMEDFNRNNIVPRQVNGESKSTDRLYRNNGDRTFTNASREAGILIEGYGLGVHVADLNVDGYPDIYVANDFLSNDLIWVNQGDGTFINKAGEYLKHQTHNGMGVDIADLNNDGLPEIAVVDMLPEDNFRQKMMVPKVNYDKFQMKRELGYQDQYMRNTVQLHRGFTSDGHPRFSEIGNLLGLAATDWSWSVLCADLDNDGWKDAYITNGYRKDITNLDFINYSHYSQLFGTVEAKKQKAIDELDKIAEVEVSNYLFHNRRGWSFDNRTAAWGLEKPSFSNGAVYADLDNDGDLDLVTNNIDAPAFVYENQLQKEGQNHYLQVELQEQSADMVAQNAKVLLYSGGQLQYQELSPVRGYKSCVPFLLHFGLGAEPRVDSLVVHWLDGSTNQLTDLAVNQRIVVTHEKKDYRPAGHPLSADVPFTFRTENKALGIHFIHADHAHTDLKTTRTLTLDPAKVGPALATGDINGDGLEDFYVGGNRGQVGQVYLQQPDGPFLARSFSPDSLYQVTDALLFDADNDGDLDLYTVSGGTYTVKDKTAYQDRLYFNDGLGHFHLRPEALPAMPSSGACVRAADYDLDGDLDLFVGGRVSPGQYPVAPRTYILQNEGGVFKDHTPPSLREPGMITDAAWADITGDRRPDLILLGEWLPISIYVNTGEALELLPIEVDGAANLTNGWWMHLQVADMDQDGDLDLLAGNLGLNSKLKASLEEPVTLYVKDFDDNGAIDPLLSCFTQGSEYLFHERDLLIDQIPGMKRRFPDYSSYAEADLAHTLSTDDLSGVQVLSAYEFASIVLENRGQGRFHTHHLPAIAQLSPVMSSLVLDLDQDKRTDLLLAGNLHASETNQLGWYDAAYGSLLLQSQAMNFNPVSTLATGLVLDGDIRRSKSLMLKNGERLFLFARYGGALAAYAMEAQNAVKYSLK